MQAIPIPKMSAVPMAIAPQSHSQTALSHMLRVDTHSPATPDDKQVAFKQLLPGISSPLEASHGRICTPTRSVNSNAQTPGSSNSFSNSSGSSSSPNSAVSSSTGFTACTSAESAQTQSADPTLGAPVIPADGMATSASSAAVPWVWSSAQQGGRYQHVRMLETSLFGQVQLAVDTHLKIQVAIKVSRAELLKPKTPGSSWSSSTAPAASSTSVSKAGVLVLEDVRREARIMRVLVGADQPPLSAAFIDGATCGLSTPLVTAFNLPSNALALPGALNSSSIQQQFLDSFAKGKQCIAGFYEELELEVSDDMTHEWHRWCTSSKACDRCRFSPAGTLMCGLCSVVPLPRL